MPLLTIHTTVEKTPNNKDFLKGLSRDVANLLGKNEKYVMTLINNEVEIIFSSSDQPACYVEFKSIGRLSNKTKELSSVICKAIEDSLGVSSDRIYINFQEASADMWGWNKSTFA